jgi:hypothetical protein
LIEHRNKHIVTFFWTIGAHWFLQNFRRERTADLFKHCQTTLSWSKYYSLVSIGVNRSAVRSLLKFCKNQCAPIVQKKVTMWQEIKSILNVFYHNQSNGSKCVIDVCRTWPSFEKTDLGHVHQQSVTWEKVFNKTRG